MGGGNKITSYASTEPDFWGFLQKKTHALHRFQPKKQVFDSSHQPYRSHLISFLIIQSHNLNSFPNQSIKPISLNFSYSLPHTLPFPLPLCHSINPVPPLTPLHSPPRLKNPQDKQRASKRLGAEDKGGGEVNGNEGIKVARWVARWLFSFPQNTTLNTRVNEQG